MSESPDVLVGSYTSIWQFVCCSWQKSHCTILRGHCLALCVSRSFRAMITSQRGHGITLKGQDLKCSCEGQRQRQKSTNLMLLHLSQLRSHKDILKKKNFKPPSILVHQPIRILHYHTLRPEIRSPSPSLYLGKHPMVIQIWKKKRFTCKGQLSIQKYLFTICIFISHGCTII